MWRSGKATVQSTLAASASLGGGRGGGQVSRCLTLPPGSKGGITDGWDQVSAEERGGSAPGMHMSHLTHIWLAAKHRTTLAGQRTDGRTGRGSSALWW